MNIPDAITELGTHIGLPDLALNEDGLCRVIFDDVLTVDFESMNDGRSLHLSSFLSTIPSAEVGEALYAELLRGHLLGISTAGAHFSLSQEENEILFEQTLQMEGLDYTGFANAVEKYVNHLEAWKNQIANTSTSTDSSELPSHHFRA